MKMKLIAVLNIVAWGGFWVFGYLALSSSNWGEAHAVIAAMLAGLGFLVGIPSYLMLCNMMRPEERRVARQETEREG